MTSQKTSLDVPRPESGFHTSVASTVAGDDFLHEKAHDSTDSEVGKHAEDKTSSTSEDDSATEYPTGMKMFFIVLALVLSIFLLALDMVCTYPPTSPFRNTLV